MVSFTALYSSSRKNCCLITNENKKILLDCGGTLKCLKEGLNGLNTSLEEISAIFITHSHTDHIKALPLVLKANPEVKVYASFGTHEELCDMGINMKKESRILLDADVKYDLGDMAVEAFYVSHDTKEPFGYNFFLEDKIISAATDIGYIYEGFFDKIKSNEFLYFESNHDIEMLKNCNRPYSIISRIMSNKGHLCNNVSAEFILNKANNGLKRVMLAHLSRDANTPELAYNTTAMGLQKGGFKIEKDVELYIAPGEEASNTIIL